MFSARAVEFWFGKLTAKWEDAFSAGALERGRALYRDGAVHSVEITEADAKVTTRREGRVTPYVVLEWPEEGVRVRSSVEDEAFAQALAVAGLHEIAELVAEEMSDVAPEWARPDKPPRDKPPPEEAADAPAPTPPPKAPAGDKPPPERTAERKPKVPAGGRRLRVVFSVAPEGLVFRSEWAGGGDGGARTAEERGRLIALAVYARKARFVFEKEAARHVLKSPLEARLFLKQTLPAWRRSFEVVLGRDVPALAAAPKAVSLEARARRGTDGALDLEWIFRVGERLLDGASAALVARANGSSVILPDIGAVALDAANARAFREWGRRVAEAGSPDGAAPPYLLFSLFNNGGAKVALSEGLERWRRLVEEDGDEEPGETRTESGVPLRDYQARGVAWLRRMGALGCGALLADEMGLGKTLQALAAIAAERDAPAAPPASPPDAGWTGELPLFPGEAERPPSLVVCPASVVPVWRAQAARFYPGLRVEVVRGAHDFSRVRGGGILWLCSYARLRRKQAELASARFAWAALDEGQFIKNPDSKAAAACCAIRADNRVVLTGTPLENSATDLWSLFRFLMPGLLGARGDFEAALAADAEGTRERLRSRVAPFVLRRTKAAVASELPPKTEMELPCPLTELQRAEYAGICAAGLERLGDDTAAAMRGNAFTVLSLLTRLRQACCDPGLLPWVSAPVSESGKLSVLAERLAEVAGGGRKAVVFSQFTTFLDRAREAITGALPGLPLFDLRGSTADRERPVREFQEAAGAAVMLVSLRAGGTGITLSAADYVFLLDPWWNPAVEAQAIDRVHRIGQRNPVFVYRLVTEGTVEERIQALKAEKRGLFERVIGGLGGDLSLAEQFGSLRELVRLGAEE
ncbi:MAG: DEAD/DEAH box helicase [Opitutaceae bacterium]|jgi:hypothetical protein|nr:DEAD/DEAH box helicase [Opitutaceae bacterium]